MSQAYTPDFFKSINDTAYLSAKEITPIICKLFNPGSIFDIGSGTGSWLRAFEETGIKDYLGADGDWVPISQLMIPSDQFLAHDLTKPIPVDRRFDLVTSFEVAEHIAPEFADQFIDQLTRFSDVVIFSAAVPHQGGTHHVNEQWPEYWADKFYTRGFEVYDCLRPEIWQNNRVSFWYKQNVLVYIRSEAVSRYPELTPIAPFVYKSGYGLTRIHPEYYSKAAAFYQRLTNSRIALLLKKLFR